MDIFQATKNNIWSFKQNHPELVIKDCKKYGFTDLQLSIIRQSMLVRGINKWLKVRRDLIAYKKVIKYKIKDTQLNIVKVKQQLLQTTYKTKEFYLLIREKKILKQKLKLLEEIRHTLKQLCMTDRWQIWEDKKIEDMNSICCSD